MVYYSENYLSCWRQGSKAKQGFQSEKEVFAFRLERECQIFARKSVAAKCRTAEGIREKNSIFSLSNLMFEKL